ncbi:ABR188Wp [Eremothecium gossypii ATCC 10895]|uniref:Elongator complex protein 4 n=1 Tax=Eremothecium gossypii (strain ATCC 10895 / CBS 109.51 / FGSC 9923 / NRRL Y-1056) TaxID=284811 RepID=Q75D35_EREGS|nr:ABR188Wp [Eremothecium gossypii ATCC 10895]AAS50960.2 ABR188Wp [Eremothecium gossypii ATCC 10895]
MSFRKRSEIISGSRTVPNRGFTPIRGAPVRSDEVTGLRAVTSRGRDMGTARAGQIDTSNVSRLSRGVEKLGIHSEVAGQSHPGLRPSPATSHPTTSTGCADMDRLLGHMGLPMGQMLLVEEQGGTDFASVLGKLFAAQGAAHNRAESRGAQRGGNTHVVVITLNTQYAKELPGIFQGTRKEVKKSRISQEESKVTVQNLAGGGAKPVARSQDLRIAWRYGLGDNCGASQRSEPEIDPHPHYRHQFDITSRMLPAPTATEVSTLSPQQPIATLLRQLELKLEAQPSQLFRIVIPAFLHPAMYAPSAVQLHEAITLLHGVRSLVKKHREHCVLLATISRDLFSQRGSLFMSQIEAVFDAAICLEPFNQEMQQFLERAYKSQPNKVQHGLVHVLKLPVISDRGEMHVIRSEWAFKNGRKNFAIEEWGIPVEETEQEKDDNQLVGTASSTRDIGSSSCAGGKVAISSHDF